MQQLSLLGWDELGDSFRVVQTRACAPKTFAKALVIVGTNFPELGKLYQHVFFNTPERDSTQINIYDSFAAFF